MCEILSLAARSRAAHGRGAADSLHILNNGCRFLLDRCRGRRSGRGSRGSSRRAVGEEANDAAHKATVLGGRSCCLCGSSLLCQVRRRRTLDVGGGLILLRVEVGACFFFIGRRRTLDLGGRIVLRRLIHLRFASSATHETQTTERERESTPLARSYCGPKTFQK